MMTVISIRNFNGMSPRADQRALAAGMATAARNCKLTNSQLRPWFAPVPHVALAKAGEIRSLYRAFKQPGNDTSGFFFHWNQVVDVARSYINVDTSERTYFTGAGVPKMTDASIATSAGNTYPTVSYDLGLPKPAAGMSVTLTQDVQKTHSYSVSFVEEYPAGSGKFYEGKLSTKKISVTRLPSNKVTLSNIPVYTGTIRKIPSKRIYREASLTATVDEAVISTDNKTIKFSLDMVHRLKVGNPVTISGCTKGAYNKTHIITALVDGEEDAFIVKKPTSTDAAGATITGDIIRCTFNYPPVFLAQLTNDTSTWVDNIQANEPDPETTVSVVMSPPPRALAGSSQITLGLVDDASLSVGQVALIAGDTSNYFNGSVKVLEEFSAAAPPDLKTVVVTISEGKTTTTDKSPTGTNVTLRYAPNHAIYRDRITTTKVPVPNAKHMTAVNLEAADAKDTESRSYVCTFVSQWNGFTEESEPSPPTVVISVTPNTGVTLKGIPVPSGNLPAGDYITKRIYRTATDGNATDYYFVAEVGRSQTSFIDDVPTEELKQELDSRGYSKPPADMHSLTALPNGMLLGASGKQLCASKAYLPHAWDPLSQITLPYPIVGIGHFDNTAVVLTYQNPHLVTGASPEYLSERELLLGQGCVAKRSIVSSAEGVIYASPDGLVLVGSSGVRMLTLPYFTKDEWRELNPTNMHSCLYNGKLFVFYRVDDENQGGFLLDPADPEGGLTFLDFYATATHPDALADYLFFVLSDNMVYRFDADTSTPIPYLWRSGSAVFPLPVAFSAARVIADSYKNITLRVYYRNEREEFRLWHEQRVRNKQPFRMPTGSAWREWQIEIEGTDAISGIDVAECVSDLAGAA